jgi:serine/threonine protein phosphatase 1
MRGRGPNLSGCTGDGALPAMHQAISLFHRFRKIFRTEHPVGTEAAFRPRERLVIETPATVIYAIGDVHGCLNELKRVEQRIVDDPVEGNLRKLVVLLGDYVDRGPNSAGVLDHLLAPAPAGIERICLCGNHDDAMADFVRNPAGHLPWLDVGGYETLFSYGIDAEPMVRASRFSTLREEMAARIPARHLAFIDQLPVCARVGEVLFVHAGVEPGRTLDEQRDTDMMWIREPFLTYGPGIPLTVVHGHTPSVDITTGPGRIGIDTAAYATGRLTALRVQGGAFYLL